MTTLSPAPDRGGGLGALFGSSPEEDPPALQASGAAVDGLLRDDSSVVHWRLLSRIVTDPAHLAGDFPAFARSLTEATTRALDLSRAAVWRLSDPGPSAPMDRVALYDAASAEHVSTLPRPGVAGFTETRPSSPPPVRPALEAVIRLGQRAVGLLRLERGGAGRPWLDDEVTLARQLADQCGIVLAHGMRADAAAALAESEERQRVLLESSLDAVIMIDARSTVTRWDERAQRMFGWTREEILGASLADTIIPPEAREAHVRGMQRYLASGEGPVLNRRIELEALHKDGRRLPVELAITPIRLGGERCFSAFVRDLSDRRANERAVAVRHAVTHALLEATTMDDFTQRLLGALLDHLRWDFASLYLLDAASGLLRCEQTCARDEGVGPFADAARAFAFGRGAGLPGRVWESRAPLWIRDLAADGSVPRAESALSRGLVSGCATPLAIGSEITGVIELFSRERREPDAAILTLLAQLGAQVGQYVERKRTEERLRATEARLSQTLAAVRAGVWEMDILTGKSSWSDESCRLLGYSPGLVEPGPDALLERVHPEDRSQVVEFLSRLTTVGGVAELDYRIALPDASTRWLHDTGSADMDAEGVPLRIRGISIDISERKRIEARAERLAGVAARTHNGVLITDRHGGIEWVNEAFLALTGYASEEISGRRPGEVLFGPATDPGVIARMRASRAKQEAFSAELVAYAKTGRQFWMSIEIQPIRDARGGLSGFTALVSDVTTRKLAEQRGLLARRVSTVLIQHESLEAATPEILAALSETLDMPAAQLWRVEPGRDALVYVAGHRAPSCGEPGDVFLAVSRSLEYRAGADMRVAGVGIPGQAWGTRRTVQVAHLARLSRRAVAAAEVGVATFTAVPLIGPEGVLGVLEVGGRALYPGHELLPQTLETLAEQLAQFVLREAERRRFETVFEQSPDGMLLVNASGQVRAANARAAALFGWGRGEPLDALLDGGTSLVRAALAGPQDGAGRLRLVERTARVKGGGTFLAEASVASVGDPGEELVIVAVRDLTDRRRIEADLAHERETVRTLEAMHSALERLLSASPVALLLVAASGTILLANPEASRLLGRSNEDLLGLEVAVVLPDFAGAQASTSDGATGRDAEAVASDGRVFPVELRFNVVDPLEIETVLVSIVDLTERKRVEQAMADARDAAEAATRAKSQFLANMSHEIRTPLNAILGMSHLALAKRVDPGQKGYFQKIHDAAKGLLGILSDVLDFSKIEAGKLVIEQVSFSTEEVFYNAVELFSLKAEEKALELLASHDTRLPARLHGDPLRFSQILHNLLGNAIKFTPRGEVELRVSLSERSEDRAWIELEVRDTGIGMSEETLEGLCRPFSQADASTTRRYGGTGLGLAICRQLSELMGGSMRVATALGVGTAITVRLPFGVIAADDARAAADAPIVELRGRRMLVVADHEGSRRILCEMLRALGGDPLGVATGEQALAALGEGPPFAIVLSDLALLDMSGLDLRRRLRERRIAAPLLLMTTASEEQSEAAHAGEEISGSLRKPVRPSQLHDALAIALGGALRSRAAGSSPAAPRFARARVLVVEDNETNQEIAVELVRNLGARVSTACDGADALRTIAGAPRDASGRPFDVVLMDVQMPVMDGLDATAAIRASPEPAVASMPILAMTAHAMSGDRERSLAAGMNDHLTKPIDPEELGRALAAWLPAERGPSRAPIDIEGGVRRVGGDEDLYRRLVERFLERNADAGDRLDGLLPGHEEEAIALVHGIRGAALNLGLDALGRSAGSLERALRGGLSCRKDLQGFTGELSATTAEARAQLPRPTPPEATTRPSGSAEDLRARLRELEEPLRRRLAVRCREIASQIIGRAWPGELHPQAIELGKALTGFRFDDAATLRKALLGRLTHPTDPRDLQDGRDHD